MAGKVPALNVFQRVPDYAQQCEIDEENCSPYDHRTNRFSCPLPVGAKGHCSGTCS